MSHTPGPWSCTFASSYGDYVVHSADHYILAFCPTAHPKDNVYLIAAAPELLAACEKAAYLLGSVNHIDYDYEYTTCDVEGMLNAAIRKAKGTP